MFEVADKAGGFGAGATLCRAYNGNCLADAIPNKKYEGKTEYSNIMKLRQDCDFTKAPDRSLGKKKDNLEAIYKEEVLLHRAA